MSAPGEPVHAPEIETVGPEPGIQRSRQLDHSAGGALGAHTCHAERTSSARDHGHVNEKTVRRESACVANVNDVTTPKFPPPPPRSAQNRSGCTFASHRTIWPLASTTVAPRSESLVRPNRRPVTPWPPPIVRPLIPTVAHVPLGIIRPPGARPAATSISRAPAPIVAVSVAGCGRTVAIGETSITMPFESEYPP